MKIARVIAIKMALSRSICSKGDAVPSVINSGRNAQKNIESLGLRILIKIPRMAVLPNPQRCYTTP